MRQIIYKKYMQLAIKEASKNFSRTLGGPFGACIVKGNKTLACSRNTVLRDDATAHAEINAIRAASKKIKSFDLSGCVIYSTAEPCPMCFSAIHWSRIETIVYGATIGKAKKCGFNELLISNKRLKQISGVKTVLKGGFLAKECEKLFDQWAILKGNIVY